MHASDNHQTSPPPLDLEEQSRDTLKGFGILVSRTTPWLFEVGSWTFGGLIAFNLVLISALLTVGPVDGAILISVCAFACALPLDVAGICLLRLVKDVKDVGIDDTALQAFKDADFPDIEAYVPPSGDRESQQKRRSTVALWYALGIVALSIALTLTGLVAALWYMAWWIGVVVLAVAVLSTVLVLAVFVHSRPPASEAEKELKRRYMEYRSQQSLGRRKAERGR